MGTGAGPGGGADLRPSLGGHRAPAVALVRRTEARPGDGVATTPGAPPGRASRARLPTADPAVAQRQPRVYQRGASPSSSNAKKFRLSSTCTRSPEVSGAIY